MDNHKSYYAIIPASIRYDDRITPNAKLLYGEITALCNEKGYCWASNDYFSKLYGVSKVSVSKWINQLVDCGYLESRMSYKDGSKEILNRYLTLVNGGHKEKFNTPIKEKLKDNNTLLNTTINNTNNRASSKLDGQTYEQAFEIVWSIYPKKKGKAKAFDAFKKAIKNGSSVDDIKAGIDNYNKEIAVKHTAEKFIKHGSTWFNGQCWKDDYETESVGGGLFYGSKSSTDNERPF